MRFLRSFVIPWATLGSILVAYVLLPLALCAFYLLDLWAKAYDDEPIRIPAILGLSLLTGGYCYFSPRLRTSHYRRAHASAA